MATTQITGILNTARDALIARRDSTATPVTGLLLARIERTLDYIDYARQRTGEAETDYLQRLDDFVQKAPAGVWSTSFFAQLDAAFQADTGNSPAGGIGRNKDV